MAFPSSTLSGSLHATHPDAFRGIIHGIPEKQHAHHRRTSPFSHHGCIALNNSSGINVESFCSSPPSVHTTEDHTWRIPSYQPPSALFSPYSHKLFDFHESSDHAPLEREHVYVDTPTSIGPNGGVPVYVMMPLDTVNPHNNTLNRRRAMDASLRALKSAGVEGIMVDVWWGAVEKNPQMYNWSGYRELIAMAKAYGLKMQTVMSFHQCGGNVGDNCWIPLPPWVKEEIDHNPDLVYTDKDGRRNYEYLSLGCDMLPVLKGRSPVQVYSDFMRSFRDEFNDYLGKVIVEIQVGLGPAGELRYPAYPERNNTWQFPGIGEFECYDKYMLANLQAYAVARGKSEWGNGGPHDAGHYKQYPEETGFFQNGGGWKSPYGVFFLEWYSGMLLEHGERVLRSAEAIFRGSGAKLSGKVAGIYWHYGTQSHPAELTAGYYNTRTRDGYIPIAQMFGRHGVTLNFTCFEMRDEEQYPPSARCSPEGLLKQVTLAARKASVPLAGENALLRFDEGAHRQIIAKSRLSDQNGGQVIYEPMCSFTFLRMTEQLFQSDNWREFVRFVHQMAEGRTSQSWENRHSDTESHVYLMAPLIQEAEVAMLCN